MDPAMLYLFWSPLLVVQFKFHISFARTHCSVQTEFLVTVYKKE